MGIVMGAIGIVMGWKGRPFFNKVMGWAFLILILLNAFVIYQIYESGDAAGSATATIGTGIGLLVGFVFYAVCYAICFFIWGKKKRAEASKAKARG